MAWGAMAKEEATKMLVICYGMAMIGCSMAWAPAPSCFLATRHTLGSMKSLGSPIRNVGRSCLARSAKPSVVGLAMRWTEEERMQREAAKLEREEKIRKEREERQRLLAEMDQEFSQQKATTVRRSE